MSTGTGIEVPEGHPPVTPGGDSCLPDGYPPIDGFEYCNPVEDEEEEESSPPSPDGESTTTVNAQPPAGSSLLFGALADSGKIKQRKNGTYRMVLKGVDEIDWFTDRPERVEGTWKPQKLLRKWDKYFATSEPNAQAGFKADEEQEMVTFEMFKPKIKNGKMMFNIKPISDSGEDKLTDLQGKDMSNISLFIDDATPGSPSCFPDCQNTDLRGLDMSGQKLYSDFYNADLSPKGPINTDLSGAKLWGAVLTNANLTGADLSDALLGGAVLMAADLSGADLSGAILIDANLSDANLTSANLGGAMWERTICPDGTLNDGISPCTADQLNLV